MNKRFCILSAVFTAVALPVLGQQPTTSIAATPSPARIIFDTDMDSDCDDAAALALLHALADRGEAEILAIAASSRYRWSVPCIEVINRYYGRPDLPIGAPKRDAVDSHAGSKDAVSFLRLDALKQPNKLEQRRGEWRASDRRPSTHEAICYRGQRPEKAWQTQSSFGKARERTAYGPGVIGRCDRVDLTQLECQVAPTRHAASQRILQFRGRHELVPQWNFWHRRQLYFTPIATTARFSRPLPRALSTSRGSSWTCTFRLHGTILALESWGPFSILATHHQHR